MRQHAGCVPCACRCGVLTGLLRLRRNVRCQQADYHQALDVAHGVPPPRAAPPVLRRVVLNCWAHCVGDYHCGHAASSSGVGVLGARVGGKCLVSARREYAIFCGDSVANKPCPRTRLSHASSVLPVPVLFQTSLLRCPIAVPDLELVLTSLLFQRLPCARTRTHTRMGRRRLKSPSGQRA